MSNSEQISIHLQKLTAFIEDAQEKLRNGEILNVSHLDDEVAQICDQTLSLNPEDAMKVQPAMAAMISRLEELGLALKDFKNNLKQKNGTT